MVYAAMAALGMRAADPGDHGRAGRLGRHESRRAGGGRAVVSALVSQDVGAAFVFAIGAFTRSARIAQEQSRAAQARAEDLLKQLRASQAPRRRRRRSPSGPGWPARSMTSSPMRCPAWCWRWTRRSCSDGRGDADPETRDRMLEQVSRAQRIARDGLADTRRAIAALRGDELPGPALLDRLASRDCCAPASGQRSP